MCYDLKTGKKISLIANRGTADYEVSDLWDFSFRVYDNSIVFHVGSQRYKCFDKQDILSGIPMEKKKVRDVVIPDSIFTIYSNAYACLPNGAFLMALEPAFTERQISMQTKINESSVVLYDSDKVYGYNTVDLSSFGITNGVQKIKLAFAQGVADVWRDELAVFTAQSQFILYTMNLKNGKILGDKRYTKVRQTDEDETNMSIFNDMSLQVNEVKAGRDRVVCMVSGYFSLEDKESGCLRKRICIFDWNLKPLGSYDIPNVENDDFYKVSEDCNYVYHGHYDECGLALSRAPLAI